MAIINAFAQLSSRTGDIGPGTDWIASLIGSITLGIGGAVLVWIGRRQAAGTLKRNTVAGYRTRTTMASDATRKAADAASAGQTTWAGIVLLVGAVLLLTNPSAGVWTLIVFTTVGLSLGLVVWGGVVAQRAAKHVLDSSDDGRQ